MPALFQFKHDVRADEIDGQGHVNNLCYLRWMVDSAVAHSREQGWTPDRYREMNAGWVVRSHHIDYIKAAMPEDSVVVHTWVSGFKKVTSTREYRIVHAESNLLLATARTEWAWIDLKRHLPKRVPAEFADSFVVVAADYDWNSAAN